MVILPKDIRRLTLLMKPPSDLCRVEPHLYIILTNPFEEQVLLVNITTAIGHFIDETCILRAREHSFITHDSFVFYEKSILLSENEFKEKYENYVNNQRRKNKQLLERLNKGAFKRVCDGLCKSEETRPKIKNFYKRYLESLPPR